MLTLSAPALSSARMSSTALTPPPTVSGMNTCDATASIMSYSRPRVLDARADVEERELVGALLVVAPRDLDRIAGIAQVDEVDALDDAAVGDVEAGDDALGEAHGPIDGARRQSCRASAAFSASLKFERAFVDRAAGDGADDAVVLVLHELARCRRSRPGRRTRSPAP